MRGVGRACACSGPIVIYAPGRIFVPILRISGRIFGGAGPSARSRDVSPPHLFAPLYSCDLNLHVTCSAPSCSGTTWHTVYAAMCDPFCKIILLQKLLFWDIFGFFAPAVYLHPRCICTRGSDSSLPCARRAARLSFRAGRCCAVLPTCASARRRRAQLSMRPWSLLSSVRLRPAICARVQPSGLRT